MECIVQYLDDLEDLFYAFALKWERIRRVVRFTLFILSSVAFQILGIFLALSVPALAVATASLLLVGLLYRSVVYYGPAAAIPA